MPRAAIALLATACSESGGSSGGGGKDGAPVVFAGQAGDYQINFNPFSPSMVEGPEMIFESLFYFDQVRDEPAKPLLGTEYSWNGDGTELSVTLREGVTWSDGGKFPADDVVFTLDVISQHKEMNGTGYKGRAEAVDGTHVRITFPGPAFMDGPQILGKVFILSPSWIPPRLRGGGNRAPAGPGRNSRITAGRFGCPSELPAETHKLMC